MKQLFHLVILGADNPVGKALAALAQSQELSLHAINEGDWELNDLAGMHATIKELSPSFVINCIMPSSQGMTLAQADVLGQVCKAHDVALVQLSSNNVFSGQDGETFKEEDEPNPTTDMGLDIFAVETAISNHCPQHLILRVGWMFSSVGEDEVSLLIKLAQQSEQIDLSDNRKMCPTSACDIASVLLAMVRQSRYAPLWGTYHYCSSEPTSLFKFAEVVVAEARQYEAINVEEINSNASSEMNTLFAESSPIIATKKLLYTFGIKPKPWRQALSRILKKRYSSQVSV